MAYIYIYIYRIQFTRYTTLKQGTHVVPDVSGLLPRIKDSRSTRAPPSPNPAYRVPFAQVAPTRFDISQIHTDANHPHSRPSRPQAQHLKPSFSQSYSKKVISKKQPSYHMRSKTLTSSVSNIWFPGAVAPGPSLPPHLLHSSMPLWAVPPEINVFPSAGQLTPAAERNLNVSCNITCIILPTPERMTSVAILLVPVTTASHDNRVPEERAYGVAMQGISSPTMQAPPALCTGQATNHTTAASRIQAPTALPSTPMICIFP